MQDTIRSILGFHIAVAVLCAVSFWPPLFLNKGGRGHVIIGKLYAMFLALMTSTALTVTVLSFMDAAAAAQRPNTGMLLDRFRSDPFVYRSHLVFLAFVAIGAVQSLIFGLRSLKPRARPAAVFIHSILGSCGLGIAGLGVHLKFLPMIAVGLVGALLGAFCAVRSRAAHPEARLADHLTGVIASGVLSYSAIAIVVANRVIPEFFHSELGIVIWVLPTLIGLPFILVLRRTADASR